MTHMLRNMSNTMTRIGGHTRRRCPRAGLRFIRCALLVLPLLVAACQDSAAPATGPGDDPWQQDPGVAGVYRLATVNGIGVPALLSSNPVNGSKSYIMGGQLNLVGNSSYTITTSSRFEQGGTAQNNDYHAKGTWQHIQVGYNEIVRLRSSSGGMTQMERTWYSLTQETTVPGMDGSAEKITWVWVR